MGGLRSCKGAAAGTSVRLNLDVPYHAWMRHARFDAGCTPVHPHGKLLSSQATWAGVLDAQPHQSNGNAAKQPCFRCHVYLVERRGCMPRKDIVHYTTHICTTPISTCRCALRPEPMSALQNHLNLIQPRT